MKQPAILVISAGLVLGVVAGSFGVVVGLLGLLISSVWRTPLLLVGVAVGLLRITTSSLAAPPGDLVELADRSVMLEGEVVGYPENRGDRQVAILQATAEGRAGRTLAYLPPFPELGPGDVIRARGTIVQPPQFPDFNYRAWLAKDHIHSVLYHGEIAGVSHRSTLAGRLYSLRRAFLAQLERQLPEPEVSFLSGILLGERSGLPETLQSDFQRTGTAHLIALSGYNVSIVLGMAIALVGRRPFGLVMALVGLIGFVLLAGPSASIVRAALMGAFILIGQGLGRPQTALHGCVLTAALMLLLWPWSARYDLGFSLSFVATLGILTLYQPLLGRLHLVRRPFRQPLAVTLAAGLPTMPLIALSFGTVSLISPVANLVAVPVVPGLMLGGFVTGAGGLLGLPFSAGIAWLTLLATRGLLSVISWLAGLPTAAINFEPWRLPVTTALTALTAWLIVRLQPWRHA